MKITAKEDLGHLSRSTVSTLNISSERRKSDESGDCRKIC